MNNHNILKYYGSKLDVKIDSSEYYDYELGKNEIDYNTDILDLSEKIQYLSLVFDSSTCLDEPIDVYKPFEIEIGTLIGTTDYEFVTEDDIIITTEDDDDLIYMSTNCEFNLKRRNEAGWTLDFIFNRNDLDWSNGSVFYYAGIKDEYIIENFADNNLSFSFTEDGKIRWQVYRYSGYCEVSSFTETYYIDSGETPTLCSGGTLNDFNVTITFDRYSHYLTECDLENEGGWNDLITGGTLDNNLYSVITGDTPAYTYIEMLNQKWVDERKKRLGILKIYLNGNPIYKLENWEEVIPSKRNSINPIIQVFGGGTLGSGGLHEGTCGFYIHRVKYFESPLDFVHVKHHYFTESKLDYDISECVSECINEIIPILF